MKPLLHLLRIALLGLILALSACGQKGPLTMPAKPEAPATTATPAKS